MTLKAFSYRFYPTPEQESLLRRTMGCARLVYNRALALRTEAWYKDQKRVGYAETSSMLTEGQKTEELDFLNQVSCVPLQQCLRHLQTAYTNFFDGRVKYPNFKKKRNGGSIEVLPPSDKQVGIDLGITSLLALSTGEKLANPKGFKAKYRKLRRTQKALSRKQKGSKNRHKTRLKVARVHQEIADATKDNLHKLTTRLVRENQTIAVENLAVKNLLKNRKLAASISDASWGELVRQLEYKCDWYGRTLIKIDRWFPSSKRCFECGYIVEKMPLNVREWDCPNCGTHHNRDINAAKNILAAGLAVERLWSDCKTRTE